MPLYIRSVPVPVPRPWRPGGRHILIAARPKRPRDPLAGAGAAFAGTLMQNAGCWAGSRAGSFIPEIRNALPVVSGRGGAKKVAHAGKASVLHALFSALGLAPGQPLSMAGTLSNGGSEGQGRRCRKIPSGPLAPACEIAIVGRRGGETVLNQNLPAPPPRNDRIAKNLFRWRTPSTIKRNSGQTVDNLPQQHDFPRENLSGLNCVR